MKEKLFLIFLFLSHIVFTQTFDNSFITSDLWHTDEYDVMLENYLMEFKLDGSFLLKCISPGFVSYASGKYQLIGNNKIKTTTENQFDIPKALSNKDITWSFSIENNRLMYYYKLSTDTNYFLYLSNCPPPPNSKREVDGIAIKLLNFQSAITKSNVKVSRGPGKEYETYVFDYEGNRFNSLPEGTDVIIQGIPFCPNNENKGDWYYCRLISINYDTIGTMDGWIFCDDLHILGKDSNFTYY